MIAEIGALRDTVRETRSARPFNINALVVLPDHLQYRWTLPPGDSDFPTRWRKIKALFSTQVAHPQDRCPCLKRKREAGVWQRRYWQHTIRDDPDERAQRDEVG